MSSPQIARRPDLSQLIETQHAEPPASARSSGDHLGRGPREPADPFLHALHVDLGCPAGRGDVGDRDAPDHPTGERGEKPESQDLRVGSNHHHPVDENNPTTSGAHPSSPLLSQTTALESWEVYRAGSSRHGSPLLHGRPKPSCTGPKHLPTNLEDDDEQPSASGHQQGHAQDGWNCGAQSITNLGRSTTSATSSEGNSQLSMTQAALDARGQKVIGWGKKHMGDTCQVTYTTPILATQSGSWPESTPCQKIWRTTETTASPAVYSKKQQRGMSIAE